MNKSKQVKIRLHVLSPIHIGCGEVYEPTSFIIDENTKKLIEFDPFDYIKSLTQAESKEFEKVVSGDKLLAIFKTIKRFYKRQIKCKEVDVTDYLIEHYKKILEMGSHDKKAVINQFTIEKTAYNSNSQKPYIPGSSLKGALRTGYLNALAKEKGITKRQGKSDELESLLLDRLDGKQKMSSDPFRMVKVSDLLPVNNVATKILYAVNKKKKKNDKELLTEKSGIYQIFETLQPGASFEGTLKIDTPEKNSGINKPIELEKLLRSAHSFYASNLNEEKKYLSESLNIGHKADILGNSNFKFEKSAFLIRIGKHSGAEAVTIDGCRKIKIMQGRGRDDRSSENSTTFWLASNEPKPVIYDRLIPFGWAVLEVV